MGFFWLLLSTVLFPLLAVFGEPTEILNVSYDPTREFYDAYNQLFSDYWKEEKGEEVFVLQSHGGSGRQARAVINGLGADVVTLALAWDIDRIADAGLIARDWQSRLPYNSSPYTSVIVFLVRKGNPKGIKDWPDLVKEGVEVVTPNPKTSGGARWNYLAGYAWALKHYGDEKAALNYMKALFQHVPMLDVGARAATITFAHRHLGDVLIAWENEAMLIKTRMPDVEIVVPSLTILAEPPVAVVDEEVRKHGTLVLAEGYLKYLYSLDAQRLMSKNFFRPRDLTALTEARFPEANTVTITDLGGWPKMQKMHFDEGGIFDQIYAH